LAEHDDPAEAAARLEAALERIARQAHKVNRDDPRSESLAADYARISARLDALIAQLRAALDVATGP
jgi:LPS O-antigen subunit length determinant protein (WzzB/FepE family)